MVAVFPGRVEGGEEAGERLCLGTHHFLATGTKSFAETAQGELGSALGFRVSSPSVRGREVWRHRCSKTKACP